MIYKLDDAASHRVALYYAAQRNIPSENVIGIHVPNANVLLPDDFALLRAQLLDRLPSAVQSLLLVWSKPYAVGCMSITSAVAAGYSPAFCPPGCARTPSNPLFNSDGWLPTDTVGWWPAMLLPSDDEGLAHRVIQAGMVADSSAPPGILYLVRTSDAARNVRAKSYSGVELALANRVQVTQLSTPVSREIPDAIGYFTGAVQVEELPRIEFRPGALADHLTSTGGVLEGGSQMPASAWLERGATASYGSVSEPCNYLEKFPNVNVLFEHYAHGETALESYWKSVLMVGQGLFIGEPLSRPFGARHQ
ncbi:MAG: TIGR03790 family protein [Steroidobacteraceae bacterium]